MEGSCVERVEEGGVRGEGESRGEELVRDERKTKIKKTRSKHNPALE